MNMFEGFCRQADEKKSDSNEELKQKIEIEHIGIRFAY